jgi:hypothetical protein
MRFRFDDSPVVNPFLRTNTMNSKSLTERIALMMLAAFASTSTFALVVLGPMAASGGLA